MEEREGERVAGNNVRETSRKPLTAKEGGKRQVVPKKSSLMTDAVIGARERRDPFSRAHRYRSE